MVPGRVQNVLVNVGDAVKQGQVIMEMVGLEIGAIKAQYINAKSQLSFAETAWKRQKMLLEQNVGSQKALNEAEMEYRKAQADFTAEDKKIHSIGLTDAEVTGIADADQTESHRADLLALRSPIAGIVVERNVVPGQFLDATTIAMKIVNSSKLIAEGQFYVEGHCIPRSILQRQDDLYFADDGRTNSCDTNSRYHS
jgi:cobalt-zinc-cadmium efflux system membrane fusion protein